MGGHQVSVHDEKAQPPDLAAWQDTSLVELNGWSYDHLGSLTGNVVILSAYSMTNDDQSGTSGDGDHGGAKNVHGGHLLRKMNGGVNDGVCVAGDVPPSCHSCCEMTENANGGGVQIDGGIFLGVQRA